MIAKGMEWGTSHRNAPVFTGLVKDRLVEELQVGYNVTREEVKNLWPILVGEVNDYIIQQGKMNSLLTGIIEAFTR